MRRKLVHLLRGSRVPDVDALVGTRGTQQVVLLGHRAAQQRRGAALRRRHRSAAASARVDNRGGRAGEPRPRARLDVPFGDAAVLGHRVARGIVRGERHARHRQLMPAAYVPPRVASCVFVVFVFDVGVGVERRRDDAVRNLPAHAARLGHRLVLEPVRQPVVAVHVSDVVLVVLLLRPRPVLRLFSSELLEVGFGQAQTLLVGGLLDLLVAVVVAVASLATLLAAEVVLVERVLEHVVPFGVVILVGGGGGALRHLLPASRERLATLDRCLVRPLLGGGQPRCLLRRHIDRLPYRPPRPSGARAVAGVLADDE